MLSDLTFKEIALLKGALQFENEEAGEGEWDPRFLDDDDYMISVYRIDGGEVIVHFNERAGGNYAGEYRLHPNGTVYCVETELLFVPNE
jgi:hypothetical protein